MRPHAHTNTCNCMHVQSVQACAHGEGDSFICEVHSKASIHLARWGSIQLHPHMLTNTHAHIGLHTHARTFTRNHLFSQSQHTHTHTHTHKQHTHNTHTTHAPAGTPRRLGGQSRACTPRKYCCGLLSCPLATCACPGKVGPRGLWAHA